MQSPYIPVFIMQLWKKLYVGQWYTELLYAIIPPCFPTSAITTSCIVFITCYTFCTLIQPFSVLLVFLTNLVTSIELILYYDVYSYHRQYKKYN